MAKDLMTTAERGAASASKARYNVITFVIDAGYRGLSARLAYRTSPVFASTTTAAYFGWLSGSWRYGIWAWAVEATGATAVAAAMAIDASRRRARSNIRFVRRYKGLGDAAPPWKNPNMTA